MELVKIAEKITSKIGALEKGRGELKAKGERSAQAEADYDKAIAVTLIQLRNGVEFDLEGHKIKDPPATITEKIARGICYKQKLEMELAQSDFKATVSAMNSVMSELNAYQTIYRRQTEV